MTPGQPVIFLHIGAMKTGTTFLQQLLIANRGNLARAGYLFPGKTWERQVRATQEILRLTRDDPEIEATALGAWDEIVGEMLAYDGHASILSMEFLSFADPKGAARVVRSLEGAEVHIILTVRDAVRTIPAMWQTSVHNGGVRSWPDFARGARKIARLGRLSRLSLNGATRAFWRSQAIPRMLHAWSGAVPPERFHVVTVPPAGSPPTLLWDRIASVVGVDPAVCTEPTDKTNASLGPASTELLRRLNAHMGPMPQTDYNLTVKTHLGLTVLARRARIEQQPMLDPATQQFALDWNRRIRQAVETSGAHVVGDLGDLPVQSPQARTGASEDVLRDPEDKDLLAAAAPALDGMRHLVRQRTRLLRKRGIEGVGTGSTVAADLRRLTTPDRWNAKPDPVEAAVSEIADLVRIAIELRHRLRGTR